MRWITFLWWLGIACSVVALAAFWQHDVFAAIGFALATGVTVLLIERESR